MSFHQETSLLHSPQMRSDQQAFVDPMARSILKQLEGMRCAVYIAELWKVTVLERRVLT